MASFDTGHPSSVTIASGATAGVTLPTGATSAVERIAQSTLPVQRVRVDLNDLVFAMTTASDGAADGQGQKILTLPEGAILVLGSRLDITLTAQAGLSAGASTYIALGTVVGAADDADLTSTEADVGARETVGALVASTAKTHATFAGAAPALIDGTTTAADVFLNISGTFTHASANPANLAVTGTVEVFFIVLGDD